MRFLKLQTAGGRREVTGRFGGYWPEDGAAENQFYDMRNLCADAAPFLMPRGKRTKVFEGETPQGIHGGEKLLYADAGGAVLQPCGGGRGDAGAQAIRADGRARAHPPGQAGVRHGDADAFRLP